MKLCFPVFWSALIATQAVQDLWIIGLNAFTGSFPNECSRVAAEMMLRLINDEGWILPGYNLRILWQDDECNGFKSNQVFMDNMLAQVYHQYPPLEDTGQPPTQLGAADISPGPVATLSTGCSAGIEPLVKWAHGFRMPLVASFSTRPELSDHVDYPNFFRVTSDEILITRILCLSISAFGIDRAAVVVDESTRELMGVRMVQNAKLYGIELKGNELSFIAPGLNGTFIISADLPVAKEVMGVLWGLKCRVVIALAIPEVLSVLLCAQAKEGMHSLLWATNQLNTRVWIEKTPSCTADEMIGVAVGTYAIQAESFAANKDQNMTCSRTMNIADFHNEYFTSQELPLDSLGTTPFNYSLFLEAPSAADGVCMIAMMLRQLLIMGNLSLEALASRTDEVYKEAVQVLQDTNLVGIRGNLSFGGEVSPIQPRISLHAVYQVQATRSPCMGSECGPDAEARAVKLATFDGNRFDFEGLPVRFHFDDEAFPLPVGNASLQFFGLLDFNPNCTSGFYNAANRSCEKCGLGESLVGATGVTTNDPKLYAKVCQCSQGLMKKEVAGGFVCEVCPSGRKTAQPDSTACEECEAGRYAPWNSSKTCKQCEVGRYSSQTGASACTDCRRDQSTYDDRELTDGSSTQDDCKCDRHYRPDNNNGCVECSEGWNCPGANQLMVDAGYFSWETDLSIFRCVADGRCRKGLPGANCAPNRTGLACADCKRDTTPASDGSCEPCSALQVAVPALGALVSAVLLTGVYFLFQKPPSNSSEVLNLAIFAGLLVTTTQVFNVAGSFNPFTQEPLKSSLQLLRFFSLNFDIFSVSCLEGVKVQGRFLVKVTMIFVVCAWLTLVHCCAVLISRMRGDDRGFRWYVLKYVMGTIVLGLYISVVAMVLSPLQCDTHPNNKMTMTEYPGILCWESSEHREMVIISIAIFLCVPVPLVARVAALVRQFPQRMRMGDSTFLRANGFLFFRFRPERHWYCLVILARSLFCASVLVLPDTTAQALLLQCVMTLSLLCAMQSLPWRTSRANQLEVIITSAVVIFCSFTTVMVRSRDGAVRTVSIFSTVLVALTPLIVSSAVALLLFRRLQAKRRGPRFQFFLCHHKAGAGAFTRLLKQLLMEDPGVTREVFVDSDNLENLSALFSVVASETETLVIIASRHVFQRPWCVGEMTVARFQGVRVKILSMPDMSMPSDDFIENPENYIGDIEVLTAERFSMNDVRETLAWVHEQDATVLSTPLLQDSLLDLVSGLSGGHKGPKKHAQVNEAAEGRQACCILADPNNLEAVAAAFVLQRLMLPYTVESRNTFPIVLSYTDEDLPVDAAELIIMLSEGVFENDWVLLLLVSSAMLELKALTVTLEDTYRFPTRSDLELLRVERGGEVASVVSQALKEISVAFQPQYAPLKQLEEGAREVARRLNTARPRTPKPQSHQRVTSKALVSARALVSSKFAKTKKAEAIGRQGSLDQLEQKPKATRLSWVDAQEDAAMNIAGEGWVNLPKVQRWRDQQFPVV